MDDSDDRRRAEESLYRRLESAAQFFFEECAPNFNAATSENRFILLADTAYYAKLRVFQELRTRPASPPMSTDASWLYRLYDQAHRLLYVGITGNVNARLKRHRKRFGALLDHWTIEPYEDRAAALAAESWAIANEYPAFNASDPGPH